jgi:hypothetical protein
VKFLDGEEFDDVQTAYNISRISSIIAPAEYEHGPKVDAIVEVAVEEWGSS